jgi:hypothetical protein
MRSWNGARFAEATKLIRQVGQVLTRKARLAITAELVLAKRISLWKGTLPYGTPAQTRRASGCGLRWKHYWMPRRKKNAMRIALMIIVRGDRPAPLYAGAVGM